MIEEIEKIYEKIKNDSIISLLDFYIENGKGINVPFFTVYHDMENILRKYKISIDVTKKLISNTLVGREFCYIADTKYMCDINGKICYVLIFPYSFTNIIYFQVYDRTKDMFHPLPEFVPFLNSKIFIPKKSMLVGGVVEPSYKEIPTVKRWLEEKKDG